MSFQKVDVSADPGEPHIKLLPPPCGKTELLFALLGNQSDVELTLSFDQHTNFFFFKTFNIFFDFTENF